MSAADYSDADGQDSEQLEEAGYLEISLAPFPARLAENHVATAPRGRNREYRSTESFLTSRHERRLGDISEGQGVASSYLVVHRVHCDGSRVRLLGRSAAFCQRSERISIAGPAPSPRLRGILRGQSWNLHGRLQDLQLHCLSSQGEKLV
jgi:hypothetical protein